MQTRIFSPNDYQAIADISNLSWPDSLTTVEQLSSQDKLAQEDPEHTSQRYVVEHNGDIIAFGHYDQPPRFHRPHVFRVNISVHPHHQGQGIGSTLYKHIIEDLQSLQALSIWIKIQEDMSDGIQFVKKRGFYEELRVCEFHLDVNTFDPTPYAEHDAYLTTQGIEIKTLQELEADPERYQKLYDLTNETRRDLPATEHWTQPSYEHFLEETLNRSPACYFVALQQDRYVGVSYLTQHKEINACFQGFTGIKRIYRRQGIALALKLRTISYAKEHAYSIIKTSIDASNLASLTLNRRLGFVKQPEWIVFTKDFFVV